MKEREKKNGVPGKTSRAKKKTNKSNPPHRTLNKKSDQAHWWKTSALTTSLALIHIGLAKLPVEHASAQPAEQPITPACDDSVDYRKKNCSVLSNLFLAGT